MSLATSRGRILKMQTIYSRKQGFHEEEDFKTQANEDFRIQHFKIQYFKDTKILATQIQRNIQQLKTRQETSNDTSENKNCARKQ